MTDFPSRTREQMKQGQNCTPLVIPVFIPHLGCHHLCIFCNQYRISGYAKEKGVSAREVADTIENWLRRSPPGAREVQVAFYGGSFTGMEPALQEELLEAVVPYFARGVVHTIRLSTRPDYIDRKTVAFLRRKKVGIVELGVQSLDDRVLEASRRGHTAGQAIEAIRTLREGGFVVGVQLMLGLPRQTYSSLVGTVNRVAALRPDFVRIYPVLVLRDSLLANLYEASEYAPLSLGRAVAQAAWMKQRFDAHGIRTVRIGLQPGPELEANLLAGPYHQAFGELVGARIMLKQTRRILREVREGERVTLTINEKDQSLFRGVKSCNMKRLAELGLINRFTLQTDTNLPRFSIEKIINHAQHQ